MENDFYEVDTELFYIEDGRFWWPVREDLSVKHGRVQEWKYETCSGFSYRFSGEDSWIQEKKVFESLEAAIKALEDLEVQQIKQLKEARAAIMERETREDLSVDNQKINPSGVKDKRRCFPHGFFNNKYPPLQ